MTAFLLCHSDMTATLIYRLAILFLPHRRYACRLPKSGTSKYLEPEILTDHWHTTHRSSHVAVPTESRKSDDTKLSPRVKQEGAISGASWPSCLCLRGSEDGNETPTCRVSQDL